MWAQAPERPSWWEALREGPLLALLFVGTYVSLTTSGRLSARHLGFTFLAWWFVPAIQLWALAISSRWVARSTWPAPRLIDLYYRGQAPWLLYLAGFGALAVMTPSPLTQVRSPVFLGSVVLLTLAIVAWGVFLTYAFFRSGLELGRPRALGATATYYLALVGTIVGYYLVAGQLWPLLVHTR